MWVYGDRTRTGDPRDMLAELCAALAVLEVGRPGPPIERHARLAALFIATSELAQGLADAAMVVQGGDGPTPEQDAALAVVMAMARALLASWRALGDGAPAPVLDVLGLDSGLGALSRLPLVREVELKTAEGYAFYALYPEAYAAAAMQLTPAPHPGGDTVIGVRSIGVGLAAIAAVALRAAPPLSLRPVGPPFQRQLQLTPALVVKLRKEVGGRFVVVDEGPGLSGSSFGAVADALERLGAEPSRIAFLPGHDGGLGPEASDAHRARWANATRPCVDFDALAARAAKPGWRLQSWFGDLTGEGPATLRDVSGGAWRALRYGDEPEWPAANTFQERRKFLLQSSRGTWLLKFVGLGAAGERAFVQARALGEAEFAPEATALRYGFLAQPWLEEARPMPLEPRRRAAFVAHLGRYLGWRATYLPAPSDAGADLPALLEMTRVNVTEALGAAAVRCLALDPGRWAAAPPFRRVWTDNRLHAHEWMQLQDGRWLKADAVDHAAAHDLIGGQDIAWDVAGACVEFDFDAGERAALLRAVAAPVDAALVALLEPAYLAFHLGAFHLAAEAHASWPQEQARLLRNTDRYRRRLQACIAA